MSGKGSASCLSQHSHQLSSYSICRLHLLSSLLLSFFFLLCSSHGTDADHRKPTLILGPSLFPRLIDYLGVNRQQHLYACVDRMGVLECPLLFHSLSLQVLALLI